MMDVPRFDRRAIPADARMGAWHAPDGWAHRRFDWHACSGGARRGRLLFQSGRSDFLEKYLESFDHWRGQGWAVTAFDWRGQGGSGRRADESRIEPLVTDLDDFVRGWASEAAGPRVLVAHSLGAHLVLRWLAEGGAGFDAVVLLAPMLGLNAAPFPPRFARWLARAACTLGFGRAPAWNDHERASWLRGLRQSGLTGDAERYADELWWKSHAPDLALGAPSWAWIVAAYGSTDLFETPRLLEAVTVPILLLGAANDRLVSSAAIRAAAARLPNARLHVYPAPAAHELLREIDAVRSDALARIDAFFDAEARA